MTDERTGSLEDARPVIVICTRDRGRATAFYRDTLGISLVCEDDLAAVFSMGGVKLRISGVAGFVPHEHTILGFQVADVEAVVRELRDKGVAFRIYPGFAQDELGILTVPGQGARVAWFQDPDGTVLSVTSV